MPVEHRIVVAASPAEIFRIYQDVEHWSTWDPDTRAANLDGPFAVGSRGRLTPTRGSTVPMMVTAMVPDRCFTVECRIPLFRMQFDHELIPKEAGTEVVHRATFSGVLSFILAPMLTRQINAGLPVTLARLKNLAETGSVN
jgi:Polyketide cyclase / dehydrase and lipid transport